MINTNITNGLEPHNKIGPTDTTPNYFVVIKKIEQPENACNEDTLKFTLWQINKSLDSIIQNAHVVPKTLTITSSFEVDNNDLIYTKLIGYEGKASNPSVEDYINTSNYIEVVETKLSKTIDIDFSRPYRGGKDNLPSIVITIDKKYESYYKDYSTEFKRNEDDDCTGVKIFFNRLKTKSSYPVIKITIIGEPIEESD